MTSASQETAGPWRTIGFTLGGAGLWQAQEFLLKDWERNFTMVNVKFWPDGMTPQYSSLQFTIVPTVSSGD